MRFVSQQFSLSLRSVANFRWPNYCACNALVCLFNDIENDRRRAMKTVVGIFSSPAGSARAYSELRSLNLHGEDLIVLTPEASLQQIDAVPTEDGEQPGMGKALGGVIGGAMGLAAGAVVATLFLPGVGAVIAIGLGAGTLGLGGAVAGAAGGGALEELLTRGLPKDEIFLYEDALRQGRTVIVVTSEDDDLLTQSRQLMERNGAESLDAAREKWWIGLRDTGAADYDAPQEARNEPLYRSGFQSALEPDLRGKPIQDASSILEERFPLIYQEEGFQRGYARGQEYYSNLARERDRRKPCRLRFLHCSGCQHENRWACHFSFLLALLRFACSNRAARTAGGMNGSRHRAPRGCNRADL